MKAHISPATRYVSPYTAVLAAILMLALLGAEGAPAPASGWPAHAVQPATARAILDAWGAAEKQRQRFTLHYEKVADSDELYHNSRYAHFAGRRKHFADGEVRCDGSRVFFSKTEWAESANKILAIPKGEPRQKTLLWDGRMLYSYTPSGTGRVSIGRRSSNLDRLLPTAFLRGYLCGRKEPLVVVVRRAGSVRLRSKPELLDGFPCQVIEASSREGRQVLWIDTQRGNNLVKAEVHLVAGNLLNGEPVLRGYQFDATLDKVQLQQTNGIWFPTSCTYDYSQVFPDGHMRNHTECKFSRVQVNPDFAALQAFAPTMIKDGAEVRLNDPRYRDRYTWRQGRIRDQQGRNVPF